MLWGWRTVYDAGVLGNGYVNPVQTAAAGMSAESLKSQFGDRAIFYGGAYDAQKISSTMTYDEVYKAVYENVKVLGKGGNYLFAGVHNLSAEMPEHHVKAMIDAYFDARNYAEM